MKCLCCKKPLKFLYPDKKSKDKSKEMIDGGSSFEIRTTYGSIHDDLDKKIIGTICDDCMTSLLKKKILKKK